MDIHVAPDHRLQAQLVADGLHPRQVVVDDVKAALLAFELLEAPGAQPPCLVHAQVDALGAERRAGRGEHTLEQRIGRLILGEEDIPGILDLLVGRPLQDFLQVGQRLNAGDHFDAQREGVVIQLLQLLLGVAPPQVAEERLARHLVGVFAVKHHHIETEQRAAAQPVLRRRHVKHAVARDIHHCAAHVQAGNLRQRRRAGQHAPQRAEGIRLRIIADGDAAIGTDGKARLGAGRERHRRAAVTERRGAVRQNFRQPAAQLIGTGGEIE
ncbi:MAG: hypothetical protein BWY76_02094 [bacterium ADurb.Bin429]|nr:MAG: hypothetical protein BWY76_02094 [bacterium ADurb.Bin429]